jgi:O-antigen/teichoic acid export membrane protein
MSVLKKLASETATYGLSSMLGRMLNYVLVILHTKLFLPEQLSVQVQLYAYAGLALVVYTFGMETAFFRFGSKAEDRRQYYNLILSAVIVVSVVLSGLLFLFAEPIARFLEYPDDSHLVRWMAIIMATDGIVSIPFARLRLERKAKKFVVARVSNIVINVGLNLFFLIVCKAIYEGEYLLFLRPAIALFYDPELAPGYIIMANLLANLSFYWFLRKEFVDFRFVWSTKLLKPVWVYAFPILIMNLAAITNSLFDRMFLQYLLPENFYPGRTTRQAVGIYGQCFKLSIFMSLAIQAFKYAAEPFFFSKAEDKNAPVVFAAVMNWFLIVCAIMWVGISLNVDLVASIFLRQKIYHEGLAVVPWLLLGFLLLGVYYNLAAWFKLTDKTAYGTYITIAGASSTALLNFLLVPVLGYLGSALSFSISSFMMVVICYYYGQKYYPVPYKTVRGVGYILLGGAFIYVSSLFEMSDPWLAVPVHLAMSLLFIVLLLFAERDSLPTKFRGASQRAK